MNSDPDSQKGTGTKIAEKIEQFWTIWQKKKSNSPMFLTQWPFDIRPGALGHLEISLVDDKIRKNFEKISEILLLS